MPSKPEKTAGQIRRKIDNLQKPRQIIGQAIKQGKFPAATKRQDDEIRRLQNKLGRVEKMNRNR